jgi:hypothetical protein
VRRRQEKEPWSFSGRPEWRTSSDADGCGHPNHGQECQNGKSYLDYRRFEQRCGIGFQVVLATCRMGGQVGRREGRREMGMVAIVVRTGMPMDADALSREKHQAQDDKNKCSARHAPMMAHVLAEWHLRAALNE